MIFVPGGIVIAVGKGVWSALKYVGEEIDKSVTEAEAKRREAERKASGSSTQPAQESAWMPSEHESVVGAPVLRELGELCGVRWSWVMKNGRLLVAGTSGDRTVFCAAANSLMEAKGFRDGYVPTGYEPDDPRLAESRLRLAREEEEGRRRAEAVDGTPHPEGWLLSGSGRKHLGDVRGISWWYLEVRGERWVAGYRQSREVVSRVVEDERAAIRFMDRYGTGREDPSKMRKALVWGEQDIY